MQVASAHVGNRACSRAPAHPPRQPTGRGRRERSARRCHARRRPSARDEPEHVRRVSTPSTHCSTIRMGLAVVEREWLPPAAPVVYSHCVLREYRKRTHRLPWRLFAFGLQFGVLQRHAAVAVFAVALAADAVCERGACVGKYCAELAAASAAASHVAGYTHRTPCCSCCSAPRCNEAPRCVAFAAESRWFSPR